MAIRCPAVFTDTFIQDALKPTSAAAQVKSGGWSERNSKLGWLINSALNVVLQFGFGMGSRRSRWTRLERHMPNGTMIPQIPTLSKSGTDKPGERRLRQGRAVPNRALGASSLD